MTTPMKRDRSNRRVNTLTNRRWAYGVLAAVVALGVVYGVVTTEQGAAWLAVGAAALGTTGIAYANPTKPE